MPRVVQWCDLDQVGNELSSARVEDDRLAECGTAMDDAMAHGVDRRQLVEDLAYRGLVAASLGAGPRLTALRNRRFRVGVQHRPLQAARPGIHD